MMHPLLCNTFCKTNLVGSPLTVQTESTQFTTIDGH